MAMDDRHKDVEDSGGCSGNCVDAIERQSVGMGVHKTKKFSSLQRRTINSDGCGQMINNQTYSNLVYEAHHRPQRDMDNLNGHSCYDRHGVNWKSERRAVSEDEVTLEWCCSL